MTQVFIIGSSSAYGVGANLCGWADLIKQSIHQRMYGENAVGEAYEVYNFGKSGAKIDFALRLFPTLIQEYRRDAKLISILSIGGNNSKAENSSTQFVSTLDEYDSQMSQLIDLVQKNSDLVIVVGSGYVDESKTNPKLNPLTGHTSYFTNERRKQFENRWKKLCKQKGISFVGVELTEKEWQNEYLYEDGLHPNQKGHQYIADSVLKILEEEL